MQRSGGKLFYFVRSLTILAFAFCTFISQSFIPAFSICMQPCGYLCCSQGYYCHHSGCLSCPNTGKSCVPSSSSTTSGFICTGNTLKCANGAIPKCKPGYIGDAICKYGQPGCLTTSAFYTGAVQCINSTSSSSSSSGSSCPVCLPQGSYCPLICDNNPVSCNGITYSSNCDYQKRKCGCMCNAIICPLGCNVNQNTCMCDCNPTSSSSSSSSSGGTSGSSCKCPTGLRYDSVSMQCVSGIIICPLCGSGDNYVCGCDKKTYCNSCEAYKAGVKAFTAGACQTSSSGGGGIVTCSGSTAVCLSGGTPVCSMGLVGMAACKYGGPGCLTSTAFYTGAAVCSPSILQKKQSSKNTTSCSDGLVPDCGSNYGLTGTFAGQGCASPSMDLLSLGTTPCSSLANHVSSCENSESLCPANRKRFESCREDKTSCKCVCQFKTRNEKTTPRCNSNDVPVCSSKSNPVCSKLNNTPVCLDGKILCQDKDSRTIDFTDIISCKKK